MAELVDPFTCDVCGVHKGERNHWFRVWLAPGLERKFDMVAITGWDFTGWDLKHFHACGEEHALRKAAELLAGLKTASDKRTTLPNAETTAIQT
jgi:hypothetical protein